jgi:uncharacterized protein
MAEFDSYIAAWRERRARDERARLEARAAAMVLARELADVLVTRYGATRVVLVGSLARGDFAPGSDIDLAAEGVPDDRFFAAGADLEARSGGVSVDLVPLESATSAYRQRVEEEGIVLR